MTERAKKVADEALSLTPDERVELIERIYDSLDGDADIDWTPELQARLHRAMDPSTPDSSIEEVDARVRAALSR